MYQHFVATVAAIIAALALAAQLNYIEPKSKPGPKLRQFEPEPELPPFDQRRESRFFRTMG